MGGGDVLREDGGEGVWIHVYRRDCISTCSLMRRDHNRANVALKVMS